MSVEDLRAQLDALQRSHDILLKSLSVSTPTFSPGFEPGRVRRTFTTQDELNAVFADSSNLSDDSDDEDESYFVQEALPSQSFDHEHLREHLRKNSWTDHGREILSSLFIDHGRLKEPSLFPNKPDTDEDRSHYSHFQVYDVNPSGTVELVESSRTQNPVSRADDIWNSLKDIGPGNSKTKKPVGRITIAREPTPVLFGALHLTMNSTFDMDELFKHLVLTEPSSAHMHRAFHQDTRHQKTFFFNFEYYTIIGDECTPMQWQNAAKNKSIKPGHIPLTRCSSVVALALYDDKPRRLRSVGRRAKMKDGWVQDIWSPWQVLVIECFPDWKATTDTFEAKHRYLNGPEAFFYALLTEFKDARKRYGEIYKRITKLVTPPLGFLFDGELRDRRLFEDRDFTWTRRYFFAHQTLGNVNDSIKSMIDSFEDTFTNDVWEGKSNTMWPLFEESPRNDNWKERLRFLKVQFTREMKELRLQARENNERRAEIRTLQDHLFSGTSIQESRKSVELTDITVQQGRNIKLLTLVNMIFVPLTFVTSIYGMDNMNPNPQYWEFSIVLVTVCVPFFLLIGFLNTDKGYRYCMKKSNLIWNWIRPKRKEKPEYEIKQESHPMNRTYSMEEGMRMRLGERGGGDLLQTSSRKVFPHIMRMVEEVGEGKQSGLAKTGTLDSESGEGSESREGVMPSQDAVVHIVDR